MPLRCDTIRYLKREKIKRRDWTQVDRIKRHTSVWFTIWAFENDMLHRLCCSMCHPSYISWLTDISSNSQTNDAASNYTFLFGFVWFVVVFSDLLFCVRICHCVFWLVIMFSIIGSLNAAWAFTLWERPWACWFSEALIESRQFIGWWRDATPDVLTSSAYTGDRAICSSDFSAFTKWPYCQIFLAQYNFSDTDSPFALRLLHTAELCSPRGEVPWNIAVVNRRVLDLLRAMTRTVSVLNVWGFRMHARRFMGFQNVHFVRSSHWIGPKSPTSLKRRNSTSGSLAALIPGLKGGSCCFSAISIRRSPDSGSSLFSSRLTNAAAADFTNLVGSVEQGYTAIPVVEDSLASHLSPSLAPSWKSRPLLPTKPCRTIPPLSESPT